MQSPVPYSGLNPGGLAQEGGSFITSNAADEIPDHVVATLEGAHSAWFQSLNHIDQLFHTQHNLLRKIEESSTMRNLREEASVAKEELEKVASTLGGQAGVLPEQGTANNPAYPPEQVERP